MFKWFRLKGQDFTVDIVPSATQELAEVEGRTEEVLNKKALRNKVRVERLRATMNLMKSKNLQNTSEYEQMALEYLRRTGGEI